MKLLNQKKLGVANLVFSVLMIAAVTVLAILMLINISKGKGGFQSAMCEIE